MDDIDNEEYIVAWRETDGSYHSTSLSKVLEKKCGLKIPIVNYKAVPLLAKHMQVPIKKAERIYAEMFDYIVNDFGDNHNFDLSDLDLYCLNPNDLRLIHPDELKLTKEVGKGFNILERSWAEWKCSCGKIARIDGHDD